MIKVRAKFEKTGRAKYISHLDLNRCMQRAMKRSRLPIWYTEGFNPHAYIMFPLALSLGFESRCEYMDFNLTDEVPFSVVVERLNAALPEGLKVSCADEPKYKHTDIVSAEYIVTVASASHSGSFRAEFESFMSQEQILTEKRTKKKGINVVDIKPEFNVLNISDTDSCLEIVLNAPAGTQRNFNPSLLIDEFLIQNSIKDGIIKTERTKIICIDGKEFT